MASHRNISPSYAEAVARLSSSAAKSVKQDKTASKGTVSRLRYETEKRSLTGYATETYVDEGDASTLESAEAYADEAAQNAAAGVDLSTYATIEHSDAGDASILESAQAADAETLSEAEAYADEADISTLSEAETYADNGDSTTLATAESYTDAAVAEAIAGVYTVCGSCAYADLPDDAETGDVYNITEDFTLDGDEYPAGTNLVKTDDGWDALAGITDLSAYATTEYVDEAVASIDLIGYATEAYVDEAVAGVDLSGFADADSIAEAIAALPQGLICKLEADEDVELTSSWQRVLNQDDFVAGSGDYAVEDRTLKFELTCSPYLVPADEDDLPVSSLAWASFVYSTPSGSVFNDGSIRVTGTSPGTSSYTGGQPVFSVVVDGVTSTDIAPRLNIRNDGDETCTVVLGAPIVMCVYDLGASNSSEDE